MIILSGVTEITGGSDFTGEAVWRTAPGWLRLGDDDLERDVNLAIGSSLTVASIVVVVEIGDGEVATMVVVGVGVAVGGLSSDVGELGSEGGSTVIFVVAVFTIVSSMT